MIGAQIDQALVTRPVSPSYEGSPPDWDQQAKLEMLAEGGTEKMLKSRHAYGQILDTINIEDKFREYILDALYELLQCPARGDSQESHAIRQLHTEISQSIFEHNLDELLREYGHIS